MTCYEYSVRWESCSFCKFDYYMAINIVFNVLTRSYIHRASRWYWVYGCIRYAVISLFSINILRLRTRTVNATSDTHTHTFRLLRPKRKPCFLSNPRPRMRHWNLMQGEYRYSGDTWKLLNMILALKEHRIGGWSYHTVVVFVFLLSD